MPIAVQYALEIYEQAWLPLTCMAATNLPAQLLGWAASVCSMQWQGVIPEDCKIFCQVPRLSTILRSCLYYDEAVCPPDMLSGSQLCGGTRPKLINHRKKLTSSKQYFKRPHWILRGLHSTAGGTSAPLNMTFDALLLLRVTLLASQPASQRDQPRCITDLEGIKMQSQQRSRI